MEKQHKLITNELAIRIIDTKKPKGLFWTKESSGTYVGIDNSTGDAWTEDFKNLKECLKWLSDGGNRRKLNANRMLEDIKGFIEIQEDQYSASKTEIIYTAQAALTYIEINAD